MPTKLHINLIQGLFEVEGSEEFIKELYMDAKNTGLFSPRSLPKDILEPPPTDTDVKFASKKRSVIKRGGPSCAARIAELKEIGFFTDLRDAKSISEELSTKGYNYESKHIAAAMTNLTQRGVLRRVKKEKTWNYQNP